MKILLLVIIMVLAGCVSGKVEVDQAGICSFEYTSFLKDMDSPELDLCGATMKAGTSTANDELIGAVINAIR